MKKKAEKKSKPETPKNGLLIKHSLLSLSAYFNSYLAALEVVSPRN